MRIVPADEVWRPKVAIFNERDVSSRLPKEVEIRPDGTVVYRGATVLVAASLATTVGGAFLLRCDRRPVVSRVDAVARIVFPVCFLLLLCTLALLG